MQQTNLNLGKFAWPDFRKLAALAILLAGCYRNPFYGAATGSENIFVGGRREPGFGHGCAE